MQSLPDREYVRADVDDFTESSAHPTQQSATSLATCAEPLRARTFDRRAPPGAPRAQASRSAQRDCVGLVGLVWALLTRHCGAAEGTGARSPIVTVRACEASRAASSLQALAVAPLGASLTVCVSATELRWSATKCNAPALRRAPPDHHATLGLRFAGDSR